jgi:GNAT superfamily N-acetyltransferase
MLEIQNINELEIPFAVDMVKRSFHQSIGLKISDQGIQAFLSLISVDAFTERIKSGNWIKVAKKKGKIVGLVEVRSPGHILLLFIENDCQKSGIGTRLVKEVVQNVEGESIEAITVNAGIGSTGFYAINGFSTAGEWQNVNGIHFFPMRKVIR